MVVKHIISKDPDERTPVLEDYVSSPEGRLWHAVLASYFVEASNPSLRQRDWEHLLSHAKSEWTKSVCSMIDIDHGFFVEQLIKVKKIGRQLNERFKFG